MPLTLRDNLPFTDEAKEVRDAYKDRAQGVLYVCGVPRLQQGAPYPEDEAIKAYLDAHELIPKAQGIDRFEDQEFDVMYFGGCYLGKHLDVISDMQRQAVEHQLLSVEIERILQATTAPETRS